MEFDPVIGPHAEYGNPDTDDWEYIQTWSPYHNLRKDQDYPRVFFATSTRDDRVHPGHAAAANLNQRAYMSALNYAYLRVMLQ